MTPVILVFWTGSAWGKRYFFRRFLSLELIDGAHAISTAFSIFGLWSQLWGLCIDLCVSIWTDQPVRKPPRYYSSGTKCIVLQHIRIQDKNVVLAVPSLQCQTANTCLYSLGYHTPLQRVIQALSMTFQTKLWVWQDVLYLLHASISVYLNQTRVLTAVLTPSFGLIPESQPLWWEDEHLQQVERLGGQLWAQRGSPVHITNLLKGSN